MQTRKGKIKTLGTGDEEGFMARNLPSVVRSDGTVEEFDPQRILDSVREETSITEEAAREVTSDIMLKLLNAGHEVVTAPFIREQVCSLLYSREPKWRFQYTRLGMPYHDFRESYGDFFDQFEDWDDLNESFVAKVIAELDPLRLVEMVRRMAKDYIGVRNDLDDYERSNGGER
jgi:transcriptional regulator NrdR family protein